MGMHASLTIDDSEFPPMKMRNIVSSVFHIHVAIISIQSTCKFIAHNSSPQQASLMPFFPVIDSAIVSALLQRVFC